MRTHACFNLDRRVACFLGLLVPLALIAAVRPASAATTSYTNSATFFGNVAPGEYTNEFTGPPTPSASTSYSFSQGPFAYTIAGAVQPPGTWINGSIIGNNYPNFALTVTFTSGNVTAIGASFFIMNASGGLLSAPVTVTLSDGTVVELTPADFSGSYRGFTSSSPIASLTMAVPGVSGGFNAIDNLTVGLASPVPEPDSFALFGLGLVAFLVKKRKFARPRCNAPTRRFTR